MQNPRSHVLVFALLTAAGLAGDLAACLPQYTTTTVESVGSDGQPRGGQWPSISADKRYVVFMSDAAELVPGDTNAVTDYFLRDRLLGTTTCLSNGLRGVPGNGAVVGYGGALSADGRFAAFTSKASNLVSGDTNGKQDVFVHEIATGITTRVSVGPAGAQANDDSCVPTASSGGRPAISADGRYVAFDSLASNLVAGDTNGVRDIFVHDRQTWTTTRVSLTTAGGQTSQASTDCSISADGRYVAFDSDVVVKAKPLTLRSEVFVHDRTLGTTLRASVNTTGGTANGGSYIPSLSGDGRYVAFTSVATNLIANDSGNLADVFVRDLVLGVTSRVNVTSSGAQAKGGKSSTTLSDCVSHDGRYVVFWSEATNLVPGDTNGWPDFFVRDRLALTTTRVSVGDQGQQGTNFDAAKGAAITGDGSAIAFCSRAMNLIPGPWLNYAIYLRQ